MNATRRSFFQKLVGSAAGVAAVAALPPQSWAKVEQLETLKIKKGKRYIIRMTGYWPPEKLREMEIWLKSQDVDCIVMDRSLGEIFTLPE